MDREPLAGRLPVQYYVRYTDSYYDTADVRIGRPLMTNHRISWRLFRQGCVCKDVYVILFHLVESTKYASAVALYIVALQLGQLGLSSLT